jgi:hypothetical protein
MFGQPSNDLSMLLNFRDRTPKRPNRGAIDLLLPHRSNFLGKSEMPLLPFQQLNVRGTYIRN